MRLDQAIALRVMWLVEVLFPFEDSGSRNQSFVTVGIKAPYLDRFSMPAFGRFAIEIARSSIENHQAIRVISNSRVFGMAVENI